MSSTTKRLVRAALACSLATVASAASATDRGTPDWPCQQRKVATLTSSQIWDGPNVDEVQTWRSDKDISALVAALASRRTAVGDVLPKLQAYATALPAASVNDKMALVFAGVLSTLNTERVSIISGIERYNKRQKSLAVELETEGASVGKLEDQARKDEAIKPQLAKALELYDWNQRVFTDRQQNLPLACDIPPLIQARAAELATAIKALMK